MNVKYFIYFILTRCSWNILDSNIDLSLSPYLSLSFSLSFFSLSISLSLWWCYDSKNSYKLSNTYFSNTRQCITLFWLFLEMEHQFRFAKRLNKDPIFLRQLSSFTKVKRSKKIKHEWNWIQPQCYYSFYLSKQIKVLVIILYKHILRVLALKSMLVCHFHHFNGG